jgi:predicted secreted hydrolase
MMDWQGLQRLTMWRFVLRRWKLAAALFGFSLLDSDEGGGVRASALLVAPQTDMSGFVRAIGPWDWQFPRDHGAHSRFQTEWWYYTGNLADADGRRFGYQFTVFRRAITPEAHQTASEWRANQIYMAHFTLTDVQGNAFYQAERFSRGGAGLAGAVVDPRYRVWLEDWQVQAQNDDATLTVVAASSDPAAVNLTLRQVKPPALQGDGGLSRKGDEPATPATITRSPGCSRRAQSPWAASGSP